MREWKAGMRAQALRFSECVRDHGVPSFPDPGSDGRIPDPATAGINQGSPKFEAIGFPGTTRPLVQCGNPL